MVVGRELLLGVGRQIEVGGLVGRTLVAANAMPAEVAVALATWQRGGIQIDALALYAAVCIAGALVMVLALRSVVVLLALAARGEVFSLAGAGLLEVLALLDVHIGTRPEAIAARPLVRLAQQTQRAIEAFKILGYVHLIRLSAAKRKSLSRATEGALFHNLRDRWGHEFGVVDMRRQIQHGPVKRIQELQTKAALETGMK